MADEIIERYKFYEKIGGSPDYQELNSSSWKKKFVLKSHIPDRISFDSNLIVAKDTSKFPRLLTTDNVLVLPTKTPIRLLVTSNDVIHSWAVPSYGIKVDAIPGRINQQLLYIPLMGRAWGQCSELCGVNHGFMPIEIKALPLPEFNLYIYFRFLDETQEARKEFFLFQVQALVDHLERLFQEGVFGMTYLKLNPRIESDDIIPKYMKEVVNCSHILVKLKNPVFLNALENVEEEFPQEVALIRGLENPDN